MFKQSRYLLFAVVLALFCGVNKNVQGSETTTPAAENIKLDTTTEKIAVSLNLPTLSKQSLAPPKKAIVVPTDYPTIQAAIDAAEMNTVINIKPGDYEESLNLKSGVSIKGLDANSVVIHCDAVKGPVLKAENCNSLTISELTLKHTGLEKMPSDFEGQFPILLLNSSKTLIRRCNIQNSGRNGITMRGGNNTIWECNIINNKRNGVSAIEGAKAVIGKNNCSLNGLNGVHVNLSAFGTVSDNICTGNVYMGIYVGSNSNALLSNNYCEKNKHNGIYLNAGANSIISNNICIGNVGNGISLEGNGTATFLEQNVTNNNKSCGIYLDQCFQAIVQDNNIQNNGAISAGEAYVLLHENKFSILDSIASRLRTEKSRYSNGNWQLDSLYCGVGEVWVGRCDFSNVKPWFEEWIKQQPNSITPRIALAKAYAELAWEARGVGYANEVSEKGWEGFKENLEKAEKVLIEAEDLNASDPGLYAIWLNVGMGLGKTDEEMDALFEKGIAIEKYYWPLYRARAIAIIPRWGGKPGQLEAFARHAVELTQQKEGQILYLKIAREAIGMLYAEPQDFKQHGFSYKMLQEAKDDLIKHYPDANDNYMLNFSCFLACAYEDKDKAKDLFEQIGSYWDKYIWVKEDIFNKYKNWAMTKTEESPEPNE